MEKLIIKWLIKRLEKRLKTETNEGELYSIGSLLPRLKHYIKLFV